VLKGPGVRMFWRLLVALAACAGGFTAVASGESLPAPESSSPGSSSSLTGSPLVVSGVQSLDEGQQVRAAEEARLMNPEAIAEREASLTSSRA
jgi:hypothetical protein